ncbi:DUF4012 domain-containing protein [Demequina lutea]|uniref:DUF4012 domain-containing protein n=1 Tax=Demequina lutea TaxID=431489 RepID=A0A7Y9Z7U0_9MICO|nr:DUF4012 domain-containing protein [Demequina lutea]NYI40447.1 hypothetical protein [Demequina lutea]
MATQEWEDGVLRVDDEPVPGDRRRARHGRHWSGKGLRGRDVRRLVGLCLVGLVSAVAVGTLTTFGLQVLAAKDAADHVQASIQPAKDALKARDAEKITEVLTQISAASAAFDEYTHGPLWDLAAKVPWVKSQVVPLMAAGSAMGELNTQVIEPLSRQNLSLIQKFPIKDGRIDPYVAQPFVPILADAQTVITEQDAKLGAVDLTGTTGKISSGFIKLRDNLTQVLPSLTTANNVLPMVPQLLAAGTERTYLVMVQNNAEIRATGGIGGALIEVHVTDGKISMGEYRSLGDLTHSTVLPETDEELALFGGSMTYFGQDMNYTPEFPRIAEIASAFWARDFGDVPSGVISIDPVALQYILAKIQPVTIEGLTFKGSNIADTLLRDSYLTFPDSANQDRFFGLAASSLFSQAMKGDVDIKGVIKGIKERRIMAWSPAADETAVFDALHVDGTFLGHGDTVGLFINDRTGAKLGYYVDAKATLAFSQCAAGKPTELTVNYDLNFNFSGEMAALPDYVAGGFYFSDAPRGDFAAYVFMYAPLGAQVTDFKVNGESTAFEILPHDGRSVLKYRIQISPGESVSLTYTLTGDISANVTPVVTPLSTPDVYTKWVDTTGLTCGPG